MGLLYIHIGKPQKNRTRRWHVPSQRGMLAFVDEASLDALLESASAGDAVAREQLFVVLYGELRAMAQRELQRNASGFTLSPTTLLHEAYLDISARRSLSFPDRARFMAYAARAMRGLVIDYARARRTQKRGGEFEMTALPTNLPESAADDAELQRISDALDALAAVDAKLAEVVDLKFFCGFSFAEIASMRGASERTIRRDWEKARIYLHRTMKGGEL